MAYVDGYVIPISKKNLPAYRKIATVAGKVWREMGAIQFFECAGDDLDGKMGLPFPKLAKLKPGETVVFSFIIYKSRAQRDAINKKIMKDPRILKLMQNKMPFDDKRMAFGGFKVLVQA